MRLKLVINIIEEAETTYNVLSVNYKYIEVPFKPAIGDELKVGEVIIKLRHVFYDVDNTTFVAWCEDFVTTKSKYRETVVDFIHWKKEEEK